jgi:dipeptidase D
MHPMDLLAKDETMNVEFPTPEPARVWTHFFDLVAVPRPSKNEGAAIDHIERWAKQHGYLALRDKANNLAVHVPATRGSASPVILQCHVDIVSVTVEGNPVGADASLGRIPMVRGDFDPKQSKRLAPNPEGDWINAPYTTLGADNGIGVAMMMALAEKTDRPCPLQLLFTIDEEQGMTGAIGLEPEKLKLNGQRLINIDTEDDDEITVGSCGGRDVEVVWESPWQPSSLPCCFRLHIDGIMGGHSGVEINQGRANANRLAARLLNTISEITPIELVEWKGGSRRNAIPDRSTVVFAMEPSRLPQVSSLVSEFRAQVDRLYKDRDNPVSIDLERGKDPVGLALSSEASRILSRMVQAIPTGICEMTPELPLLVESSCNLALIDLQSSRPAVITCSVRGTTPESLTDVSDSIAAVAQLGGGRTKIADGYPGWKPHLDSELLQVATQQYEKLFRSPPKVHAIHAGLECGLLVEKLPGLHAISIGPTIKGNHAVGERVQISSVAKSYRYVEAILDALDS